MTYVDGFVLVIPRKGIPAYRRLASDAGKVCRDHGALEYRHRDRVNRKVRTDPRIAGVDVTRMPFDPRRMMFAGFTTLVEY